MVLQNTSCVIVTRANVELSKDDVKTVKVIANKNVMRTGWMEIVATEDTSNSYLYYIHNQYLGLCFVIM